MLSTPCAIALPSVDIHSTPADPCFRGQSRGDNRVLVRALAIEDCASRYRSEQRNGEDGTDAPSSQHDPLDRVRRGYLSDFLQGDVKQPIMGEDTKKDWRCRR